MKSSKPIKRVEALKPLSREHHEGLLLCWKIRTGFKRSISPQRIKRYTDWFFVNHLIPHFVTEEKYLFPVLDRGHDLVKKALADHRRLERLFKQENEPEKSLSLIEEELESHIRFEERVLFNEIQKVVTETQLTNIERLHSETSNSGVWEDRFWE